LNRIDLEIAAQVVKEASYSEAVKVAENDGSSL